MSFEIAKGDDAEDIVRAAQTAVLTAMQDIIKDMRKDFSGRAPGLTWDQLDYLIEGFKKKKPTIIHQEFET